MAKMTELLQTGGKAVDTLVIGATSYYKEGIVARAGSLDHGIASTRVGTHADDAALAVGTDAVVAIAGLADETSTDSVDEGDVGALRMTLSRKLITAETIPDDSAFGVATGYVAAMGALADETATDSVDEGDLGAVRMTLNRRLITADAKLDDSAWGVGTDYVSAMGALADESSSDSVDEGDVGLVRMTLDRHLYVKEKRSGTGTVTSVNDTATSTTLLAANASRLGAIIYNDSEAVLYVKLGATASTTSFTYKVAASGTVEIPFGYTGIIDGVWASDSTGAARITEMT